MKKYLSLILILFLFIPYFTSAQYSRSDSLLIRTTFTREFDRNIIAKYLNSNDSIKINAALLSISHSEDSKFIEEILKLDFDLNRRYILFALAQLGESKKSKRFLIRKISNLPSDDLKYLFSTLGHVGDSLTLEYLFKNFQDDERINSSLPSAIFTFAQRGIYNKQSTDFLVQQLAEFSDEKELSNLLQVIARLKPEKEFIYPLENILVQNISDENKRLILLIFRKLKYFPNDGKLFGSLANSSSWRVRTEFANSGCFFTFKTTEELKTYLVLLKDKNPNVSRSAAMGIKNIKILKSNKKNQKIFEQYLDDNTLTQNTLGELLISYVSLFKIPATTIVNKYGGIVNKKFIYRSISSDTTYDNFVFNYLSKSILNSSEVVLLDILPAYLTLQESYYSNSDYASQLLKVFSGDKASSLSIIADGLEMNFINFNTDALKKILQNQIDKNLNNPQFAETIISLLNLAKKIDEQFYNRLIIPLQNSKLYSLRKYAYNQIGKTLPLEKNDSLFIDLWRDAFKQKYAEIRTTKGDFTIEINYKVSPMTCANFIHLTKNGFYNGVKFHRVVPDFVIQTGDKSGTGWGGPGYEIVSEFSPNPFERGAVGIASIGKDTEGSQWFVMHSYFPHLNGRYSNWAKVVDGMEVVDSIDEGDSITGVKLIGD